METKFQTSFIPKKPIASPIGAVPTPARAKASGSLYMTLATLLFIISLLGAGGVYAYQQYLTNALQSYKDDLATREKQFNTSLIQELKAEEVKLTLAHNLLNTHLALSQIFDIVGRFTIEKVRFMSLDLAMPTGQDDGIKLSLQGYGTSLTAVAFQSKVFNQLSQYGLGQVVKNPILSNPTIGNNGSVAFGFTATIDPSTLSYEKLVSPASSASPASSNSSAPSNSTNSGTSNPFTSQ
jgi:hypothetical protein